MSSSEIDLLCISTIRTLAIDAIQKAKSGHPGTPMGMAPVAYDLWQKRTQLRSGGPDLAESRPIRALGRSRVHAALRATAPDPDAGGGRRL